MNEFKVGDKVRVYDKGMTYTFIVNKCDSYFIYYDEEKFSIKQCRKLVKKKRRSVSTEDTALFRALTVAIEGLNCYKGMTKGIGLCQPAVSALEEIDRIMNEI